MGRISALDDTLARDIIATNNYKKFMENKKLMMDWLTHPGQDDPELANDKRIPFLFFIRSSCGMTICDVAYGWLGHARFSNMANEMIEMNEIYQHEMLYLARNNMINPDIYRERYNRVHF